MRTQASVAAVAAFATSLALVLLSACSEQAPAPVAPPSGASIDGIERDASGDVARVPADPSAAPPAAPPAPAPAPSPGAEVPTDHGGRTDPPPPPAPAVPSGTGPAVPAIGDSGPATGPAPVPAKATDTASTAPVAPTAPTAKTETPPDPAPAPSGHGAGHRAPSRPKPSDDKATEGQATLPEKRGATAPAKKTDGPEEVSFDLLAEFEYPNPDPEIPGSFEKAVASIPKEIKALDGHRVLVEGYMIPMRYSDTDDGVVEFMLCRFQMGCCFGVLPRANELIEVAMPEGKSAEYTSWEPVRVVGILRVGPRPGDQTAMSGIYRVENVESARPSSYDEAPR